jgi:DNA-binding IclR family transcriptional regulator
MVHIDRILDMLRNSPWQHTEEIRKEISLPDNNLNQLLHFLRELGYIEKDDERLKITSKGLKFLELPC